MPDAVPVAIELGTRPDDHLSGTTAMPGDPASWLLPDGHARVSAGRDSIRFGPGATTHQWTRLRGALDKLQGNSIYITGSTPFRRTIEFR